MNNSTNIRIRPDSLRPLFIEMKFNEQKLASGTAFIVIDTSRERYFLVTALHNFTGLHAEDGSVLHSKGGIPNNVSAHFHTMRRSDAPVVYEIVNFELKSDENQSLWHEHPAHGQRADIAALEIKPKENIFIHAVNLVEEHARETGPADLVSVIGFPFGKSSGDGLPLWATGYVASEPYLDYENKPIMVIDCRARTGQSGSPVISFRSDGIVGHNPFQGAWTAPTSDFLGVYTGRINSQSDLGIVWKRSAIHELVQAIE